MVALATGLTSLGVVPAAAQLAGRRLGGFAADRFQANATVAEWMVRYDRCAWVTSDSLDAALTPAEQQRLGPEWFCYEADGRWHAVYGRYYATADRYDVAAHFRQADPGAAFTRTRDSVATALALPFARVLHAATGRVPAAVQATGARFNSFVRRGPAGAPEVWLLPAWQPNGWLLYGVELHYVFDRDGRMVRDSSTRVTPLRGMPPDTTRALAIHNEDEDVPTVGQTFFLLAYHRQFRQVTVYSRAFATQLYDHDGQVAWLHAARDAGAGSKRAGS